MGLGAPTPRVTTIDEITSICRIAVSSALSSFQTVHQRPASDSGPSPNDDEVTREPRVDDDDDEDKKPDLEIVEVGSSGAPRVKRRMYPVPADAPTYKATPKSVLEQQKASQRGVQSPQSVSSSDTSPESSIYEFDAAEASQRLNSSVE